MSSASRARRRIPSRPCGRRKNAALKVIAITNVVGSTLSREADAVFYTRAGMEIAVASTKAYITQLLALYMIAMEVGRIKGKLADEEYARLLKELERRSGAV